MGEFLASGLQLVMGKSSQVIGPNWPEKGQKLAALDQEILSRIRTLWVVAVGITLTWAIASKASAEAIRQDGLFHLHLKDPQNKLGEKGELFFQNLRTAVAGWNEVIRISSPLVIEVQIVRLPGLRLDGASKTSRLIAVEGNRKVYEESAAYKVRTGQSVNPNRPDLLIRVNPDYLQTGVWMDPDPLNRNQPVPRDRVDLVSLLMHELGHAFGFHSFRDLKTGYLPKDYMSQLDQLTIKKDGRYFFVGSNAQGVFGGLVPMTSAMGSQNFSHYGDPSDSGSWLDGLMGGVRIYFGRRYVIGALDLAILRDLGLPVK
ncbi:MAG: hypothetical protein AB7F86_20560 [Bdellovibrionales bacterium]